MKWANRDKKYTRCFHFDSNGDPIGRGCQAARCGFAHPDDPIWEEAVESRYKPRWTTYDDDRSPPRRTYEDRSPKNSSRNRYDDRGRDNDRDREDWSSHSKYRRPRSPSPVAKRYRSPTPRRRSKSPVAGPSKRRGSSASSRTDDNRATHNALRDAPPAPVPPSLSTTGSDLQSPRVSAPTFGPNSATSPPTAPRGFRGLSTATPTQLQQSRPMTPPPPPPPDVPPSEQLVPPPPAPTLETRIVAPDDKANDIAKVKAAEERLSLMANAVNVMLNTQKLEADVQLASNVVGATSFSSYPKAVQDRLSKQLAIATEKYKASQAEYAQIKGKWMQLDGWPVKPPPISKESAAAEESNRSKFDDISKFVDRLDGEVKSLFSAIPSLLTQASKQDAGEAMDVDEEHVGRKRRRLSTDLGDSSKLVPAEELDRLSEKVGSLEFSLNDLNESITAQQAEVKDTIEGLLEVKIDAAVEVQQNEWREREKKRKEKEKTQDNTISEAKNEMKNVEDLLNRVSSDREELVKQMNETREELARRMTSLSAGVEKALQLEEKIKQLVKDQQGSETRLAVLQEAVGTFNHPRPVPQSSQPPPKLLPEHVDPSLYKRLMNEVRTTVQPQLERLRSDIAVAIESRNSALITKVWTDLRGVLTFISYVHGYVPSASNASAGH
ncbi:hypothetical protein CPC08DRAFT_815875 [Agrocybe pediades]|nr:hypothetical protein CPC08DRAFT_815875 [Agrocybe pediades]